MSAHAAIGPVADACLCFEVAGQRRAVAVAAVREVLAALTVTPVPGAPSFACGVANLRGRIVPVVDLRCVLDAVDTAERAAAVGPVLVVAGDPARCPRIAVRVDSVAGLCDRTAVAAGGWQPFDVAVLLAALTGPRGEPGAHMLAAVDAAAPSGAPDDEDPR